MEMTDLQQLEARCDLTWPHIAKAAEEAGVARTKLKEALDPITTPPDTGLVVFGSLARDEWTSNSDVDWTLLIDGPVDPNHLKVAQEIATVVAGSQFGEPGRTGVFGNMAVSHDIVHRIGGESDTNQNTTRRILLLLESSTIVATLSDADTVRDRVLRSVIHRYLGDDLSLVTATEERARVPRFLLNDIVRFWRTMAVDYASKNRERGEEGWALRNAKLRFSRKLIFVAGLLTCFEVGENVNETSLPARVALLRKLVEVTPLQMLARAAVKHCEVETIPDMFGSYDRFLAILDDKDMRTTLQELPVGNAKANEVFAEVREISTRFQKSLTTLFFKTSDELERFSMEYGLF